MRAWEDGGWKEGMGNPRPPTDLSKPAFIPSCLKQMAPSSNSLEIKQPVNFLCLVCPHSLVTRTCSSGLLMLPTPFPGKDHHHPPSGPLSTPQGPCSSILLGVPANESSVQSSASHIIKTEVLGLCLILIHRA